MAENDEERPRRRTPPRDDDAPPQPRRRPSAKRSSRPAGEEAPAEGARRRRFALDEEELVGPRRISPSVERRAGPERRQGSREALMTALRDLPNFMRLLYRLARDPRVSGLDKAIVGAALAYAAVPTDYIPDVIPVLGELDDVVLIAVALGRLVNNAGAELLYEHWEGDPDNLEAALNLLQRGTSMIPGPLRMLLGRSS